MNHLDNLVPPDLFLSDEQEEEIQRAILLSQIRLGRANRERERRRRQMMAQMDQEASSDSEVEGVTKGIKDGKMDVTPAGSTPQELVKLDP